MKLKAILIILVGCLFFNSCKKLVEMIDCAVVEKGLINFEETEQMATVLNELNKLCVNLKPKITDNDFYGHQENLHVLIDQLNKNCKPLFLVNLISYATIKTKPIQSEIKITLYANNEQYLIDVETPKNGILKASNIHKQ